MNRKQLQTLINTYIKKNRWDIILTLYDSVWGGDQEQHPKNTYEIRFYQREKKELEFFTALFTLYELDFKTITTSVESGVIILNNITYA